MISSLDSFRWAKTDSRVVSGEESGIVIFISSGMIFPMTF